MLDDHSVMICCAFCRSGKELEADLNKYHSGGVGQYLRCKRLRYNGRVKNNPRKHLFVALNASTYRLLPLLETASGRRQARHYTWL